MKILFLVPYPLGKVASQRFRFEQYFRILAEANYQIKTNSFFTEQDWALMSLKGRALQKAIILIVGLFKRLIYIFKLTPYDFVFIHREAVPFGPPICEWMISMILKKKIIYDFDDAIWLTDKTDESKIMNLLKWRSKVSSVCLWSHKVSCGNYYLLSFARKYNAMSTLNPTTIDLDYLPDPRQIRQSNKDYINIGWTGSHSTLKYLKHIESALAEIEGKEKIKVIIVADQKPNLHLASMEFIKWNKDSEIEDLKHIDIGIMPLPDDEWSKGKCGFKALQFMSLGIPCVVSPVGVNKIIIEHGSNGLFASNNQQWIEQLSKLIQNSNLREEIGVKGRETVVKNYSVRSNRDNFLSLFE